ncbi:MAG: transposase [Microbacterium sp.]
MPPADDADELDAIAAELYALTPEEFTAARNARATTSDRALAAQIKTLRKPVVSAWAVSLLAQEGRLGEALELAAALREAQDDLDAAELSALSRQRRALVSALAGQAVEAAKAHGVTVSAAAREDVEKTLNAAMVDAGAAGVVLSGRLVKPLVAGAFEPDDLADAVGGSVPGVVASAPRDDLAERRARKAAEKAVREAERLANEAGRELARIEAGRDKARERADHLAERIADLTRDLERIRADAAEVDRELARWEGEQGEAAAKARKAEKKAQAARDALD